MRAHVEVLGVPHLRRNLSILQREVFPKAAARALNRTTTTVRKESVRTIAKKMGVKQKVVRDRSRIRKARPHRLDQGAQITFVGRSLNLIRFGARQTKRGVSAAPYGQRKIYPQTFIVDLGTGKFVGVRKRTSGNTAAEQAETLRRTKRVGRTPVVGVVGPGVAGTAADPDIAQQRRDAVARILPERLEREFDYYISRLR